MLRLRPGGPFEPARKLTDRRSPRYGLVRRGGDLRDPAKGDAREGKRDGNVGFVDSSGTGGALYLAANAGGHNPHYTTPAVRLETTGSAGAARCQRKNYPKLRAQRGRISLTSAKIYEVGSFIIRYTGHKPVGDRTVPGGQRMGGRQVLSSCRLFASLRPRRERGLKQRAECQELNNL